MVVIIETIIGLFRTCFETCSICQFQPLCSAIKIIICTLHQNKYKTSIVVLPVPFREDLCFNEASLQRIEPTLPNHQLVCN